MAGGLALHGNTQTHKHTNIQTHKHTNTQRYKDTKIQTHIDTNIHTYIPKIYIHTENSPVALYTHANLRNTICLI